MRQRIRSQSGFSLSELLVTVLVMLLATSIVAGGVVAVRNAYINITLKADAQTLLSTTISALEDDLRYASNIEEYQYPDKKKYWAFDSADRGYHMYLKNDSDTEGILVCNTQGTPAIPLVTDKTITSGLIVKLDKELSYNTTQKLFTVTITVLNSDKTKQLAKQEIQIKPVNS
ncbi:MAG: prepilin-type N-terminal cleavage/methylation domain-containing protein [Lachnospiraceae bacterium]|nr:prepilin-type N-terminal cleavage/methylation domain-containing protein [Lachnospiraceae bacterium]